MKDEQHYIQRILVLESLVYSLARHIRNPDELNATEWGARGMDLLVEVRALNPRRYAQQVKRKRKAGDKEVACG